MYRSGRRGGYGTHYRGRSGPGKGVIALLVVLILAVIGAGLWLGWDLIFPEEEAARPTATVLVPSATPTPTPTPTPSQAPMRERVQPPEVHGIYVSGPVAGDAYMDTLIDLIDRTELNAVVIDVKNDAGELTYRTDEGTALEIGACVRYIRDLPTLMAKLKDHGIYTIARICAFKDPLLVEKKPELALKKTDGTVVTEGGSAWVNPYEPAVWDYLTEIAVGAIAAGFDEVQFDYVRFPTGRGDEEIDYGAAAGDKSKGDAVAEFLEYVSAAVEAEGGWLSADVFGTVITSRTDAGLIGQDYARMGEVVDFICPMVYPSHYGSGAFNLTVPDQKPYETVLGALKKSRGVLDVAAPEDRPGVRAWLQDFTATWVKGHITYGPEELRAQIQAVYDAGYTDWILWNANNRYTEGGLLSAEGADASAGEPTPTEQP